MAKINAVQFTFGSAGRLVVLDDKGRFWAIGLNGQWSVLSELPEDPDQ